MRGPHDIKKGERYAYTVETDEGAVWCISVSAYDLTANPRSHRLPSSEEILDLPDGARVVHIITGEEAVYSSGGFDWLDCGVSTPVDDMREAPLALLSLPAPDPFEHPLYKALALVRDSDEARGFEDIIGGVMSDVASRVLEA